MQKDSFYIVQNGKLGYEHGPLQSPNQPSFYREVATHNPFQRTEEKLGTISSPPAPGSSQSEARSPTGKGGRTTKGGAALMVAVQTLMVKDTLKKTLARMAVR